MKCRYGSMAGGVLKKKKVVEMECLVKMLFIGMFITDLDGGDKEMFFFMKERTE